ncbi:MAG: heavy-metal-associated domain-containing protein [Oscillospiraceae bacterium]|jgi:Cu2+-exporting ATPase|nr:heavy-metal-associated domain-containing protein [Oscillospiraceae bacterium]
MTKTIMVGGMACAECAEKVRKALEAVAGVESVFAEQSAGVAVVNANAPVDDAALRAAVEGAGYTVLSIC